jgi:hypothetical protein
MLLSSWEDNSCSPTQGNPSILWKPEGSLQCPQEPTVDPYPHPDESSKFPYYAHISEFVSCCYITLHVHPSKLKGPLNNERVNILGFYVMQNIANICYYSYTYIYTSCSHHAFCPLACTVSFKPAAPEKQRFTILTSRYQSHKTKPYIWFPSSKHSRPIRLSVALFLKEHRILCQTKYSINDDTQSLTPQLWQTMSSLSKVYSIHLTFQKFIPVPSPGDYLLAAVARDFTLLHVIHTWLWDPPSILPNGYLRLFLRGWSSRGMKLTNHLHLELRLRTIELCLHSPIHFHDIVVN